MADYTKKSDKQLVKAALQDEDAAFEEMVERYEAKLERYIRRISSFDTPTIEDTLQEIFINVYRNLNGYDEDFTFSSWIYRIAHNAVISQFRKFKVRPQTVSVEDDDTEIVNLIPDNTDLPGEMNKKELRKVVRKALSEISREYREVLVLRFLEDLSYSEISDVLKKPINTVSVYISRAKAALKEKLTKYHV